MAEPATQDNPFLNHLEALLVLFERGTVLSSASVPKYDGPHDAQTEAIERRISAMARRMLDAEAAVADKNLQSPEPLPADIGIALPQGEPAPVAHKQQDAVEELQLLNDQVQAVTRVCQAVAAGDLSQRMTISVQSAVLVELKDAINGMVAQLHSIASEVTRLSRAVGTEGEMGECAQVDGVRGMWKVMVDDVDLLAENFTTQVRCVAEVAVAVARGDLTKTIDIDVKGEHLELKEIVNHMTDRLRVFAGEITCLAKESGTTAEGNAHVGDNIQGTWREVTETVHALTRKHGV